MGLGIWIIGFESFFKDFLYIVKYDKLLYRLCYLCQSILQILLAPTAPDQLH